MNNSYVRVLLIEDDEDDYVIVRSILSEVSFNKYILEWASTYEEALRAFDKEHYDVCLLDYRLGEYNGLDLLREIIDRGVDVPVILLTGQGEYNVDIEAMRSGAADYLVKGQINPNLLDRSIRYAVERKLTEREIRKSEQKYRQLIETMNEGLGVRDDRGVFTYVNDKLCEMVGFSRDELIGKPVAELLDEQNRAVHEEETIKQRRGERTSYELELKAKDGLTLSTMMSASPLFDQNGTFIGSITSIADITARKQAEKALRESEKQLRQLSSQLLNAQEEERKRLARELHDSIGSSLTAIKFSVEKMLGQTDKSTPVAQSLQDIISTIQYSIDESRRIMNDLRPSLLDDIGVIATIAWFCREFQKIYSNIHIERQITVEEEAIPERLKTVIFRIVQEAMNNIAKYSRAEWVTITLDRQSDRITLSVEDTGLGFDLSGVLSTRNPSGGMGLSSMKERTELSGGSFSIESSPGDGTTVRASWPCVVEASAAGQISAVPQTKNRPHPRSRS